MASSKLKKSADSSKVVLKKLVEEQEKVKSKTLKKLLNEEIEEYFSLAKSFESLVTAFENVRTTLCNNNKNEQFVAQILQKRAEKVIGLNSHDGIYKELKDIKEFVNMLEIESEMLMTHASLLEKCCNLFAYAIERDIAKWETLTEEITTMFVKKYIDYIPVLAEISKVWSDLKEIVEVIGKYMRKVPNYNNADNEILLIETHIQVMKETKSLFAYVTSEMYALINIEKENENYRA